MSRRVNALKQKIVENIRNRTPGFRESVPSIRDLISRFDETHHVVNSALKELVDDGVLNSPDALDWKKGAAPEPFSELGLITRIGITTEDETRHPTLTVGEAFDRYQFCESPSRLWEELEPGSIEFSCKLVPGGIFQVYWAADKEGVRLRSVTVTTMADAEFAGIDFRRDDAQAILKRVVENRLPPLD